MTNETAQGWHGSHAGIAKKMTLRLGGLFQELCDWAVREELDQLLEVSYHILGLDSQTMGIPNLIKELAYPESQRVLKLWSDNSSTDRFLRLAEKFNNNETIRNSYQPLSHKGSATQTKRRFPDLSTRTFLLTLFTHPLAVTDQSHIFELRRALRLWLFFQAVDRLVRYGCIADSAISDAARFLILDSTDPGWALVDRLLSDVLIQLQNKGMTYQRFGNALKSAAERGRQDVKSTRETRFLNSIGAIAKGNCQIIEARQSKWFSTEHLKDWRFQAQPRVSFEADGTRFEVLAGEIQEEEGGPYSFLAEVDPTDSPAQQTLSSGSVLIQSIELSHYLPWSWDRLLPPEAEAIDEWLNETLSADGIQDRLGAVFVWLSMNLSRSLALVERIVIGDEEDGDEWGFSNDFQLLYRASPRRHSGWKPDDESTPFVAPTEEILTVETPEAARTVLLESSERLDRWPASLGELWAGIHKTSVERWFNQQTTGILRRITSAKLANRKAQTLFESTADHRFARLLTSHPQTALPGACSYSTWNMTAIEKGLGLSVYRADQLPEGLNLIGSRLVPFKAVLVREIQEAQRRLHSTQRTDMIDYHNALAQYVVMALYAATGSRPLRDPFESARLFSLSAACVYVNDKSDDGLHNGRLVPLPSLAIELVKYYQSHLITLAREISLHRSELSDSIRSLLEVTGTGMPLFFLLDRQLRWHSMADAGDVSEELFRWPLPANLFRHHYAQELSASGVDAEVIEGWMGHAERGVATYSDYSPRCWENDARHYREVIDEVFERLGFSVPNLSTNPPPLKYLPSEDRSYKEPKTFGIKSRAAQRKRRLQAAIQDAKYDIALFLGERALEDISADELAELSNQMLLRSNQLPHPQASLRFRILAKKVERSSLEANKKFKKRVVTLKEEKTLVKQDVIRALEVFPLLQGWADKIRLSAQKAKLTKTHALCIGAALLAIEKRLSYRRLLIDVTAGRHFRVVQCKNQFFFEYNESLIAEDFSEPVQRHEISYKTASLLAHGLERTQDIAPPEPGKITAFQELLSHFRNDCAQQLQPSNEEFFDWLADTISQCNLVQLPGMVSAALSERVPPTSASWADTLRLTHNCFIQLPEHAINAESVNLPNTAIPKSRKPESDKCVLQINADQFISTVHKELKQYRQSSALDTAKAIEQLCIENRAAVSVALILLAHWIAATIRRGKGAKGRKFKPYAGSSLENYWGVMNKPFAQLAYSANLVAMDNEEVTELCDQMLQFKRQSSTNTRYFAQRLLGFFNWAGQIGVESPDWTELDMDVDVRTVSPGLIGEQEYLETQHHIRSDSGLAREQRLMLGFVLLCCYRFGLRAREAICLLRRDWQLANGHRWILVQNNQYRHLKSTASRRAVPLLFQLSGQEEKLIEQVLSRYHSICGDDTKRPILCETTGDTTPALTGLASRLSLTLILAIRTITRSDTLVLHHCRHTFYNRVATALLALDTPSSRQIRSGLDPQLVQKIVLGVEVNQSRRVGMALARLMGHQSPRPGMLNYAHLLTEWADQLTPVKSHRLRKIRTVKDMMALSMASPRPAPALKTALEYPEPTIATLLQTLHLVALGQSWARAGSAMQLPPNWGGCLEKVFSNANNNQSHKGLDGERGWLDGKDCPNALLESISPSAWHRLIHHANELDGRGVLKDNQYQSLDLDELPILISRRRHLVMDQPEHALFARQFLKLFDIADEQYHVIARFDDPEMIGILMDAGFGVESEYYIAKEDVDAGSKYRGKLIKKPTYLHGFPIYNRRQGRFSYGEIIIPRSPTGVIRNSYELAVSFLTIGVYSAMT